MFSNRRKRTEQNKIIYYSNRLSEKFSPRQGIVEELQEIELWDMSGRNIYNTNSGNVGIGITDPSSTLDVSGTINVSQMYTMNYIPIVPPVGSIMAYVSSSSPDGWLLCIGTAINRIQYSQLFHVIGIQFGSGNGTTTFNLPDYRGAFLRGTGTDSTGKYIGPALDMSQNHATQTHGHTASSTVNDPGHTHNQNSVNDDYNNSGGEYPNSIPSFPRYDSAGIKTWNNISTSTTGITVSTSVANSTTNTDPNETRPYNFGVYWIIKY
jgi:microcystin-dependent protein